MGVIRYYYDLDGLYLHSQDLRKSLLKLVDEAPDEKTRIILSSVVIAIGVVADNSEIEARQTRGW